MGEDSILQTQQGAVETQEAPEKEPEHVVVDHVIEIEVADSGMIGYVKVIKGSDDAPPITVEQIKALLEENKIIYGIKDSAIEKLVERPIYGIRIEIAKGLDPINGEDGHIDFFVVKDSEYKPEIEEEGIIDYKNLDYFQMVKAEQMLCAITKEKEGTPGQNILGQEMPAKEGKPVKSPQGKNTSFNEDETILFADCDGMISFTSTTIDVNDTLRITSDVNMSTGNINFSGDVMIDGDVCTGFSVIAGGNVVVKGVVEGATIEADGNVQIAKGINGEGDNAKITVGGDLRCKYIETASIYVQGNLTADYIIDSNITCMSNIELIGGRGVLVGGETKVKGELIAKDVGSEREKTTKIEVLGIDMMDSDYLMGLKKQREELQATLQQLHATYKKYYSPIKTDDDPYREQLVVINNQIDLLEPKLDDLNTEIASIQHSWTVEYLGAVVCKRRLYRGTKISFGEGKFTFNLDSLERCRICWNEGQILQQTI